MSLQVIKYVAGGGKTTRAINFLKNNKNGLYLAFNNKVVNDVESKGYLSMTIDSLFVSYILPKIKNLIPFFRKLQKFLIVILKNYHSIIKVLQILKSILMDIFAIVKKELILI